MADDNARNTMPTQEDINRSPTRSELTTETRPSSTRTSPSLRAQPSQQAFSQAPQLPRDAARKRPRPLLESNYGSISGRPLNPPQSQTAISPSARTPKKPSLGRRSSSHGPHRGQEFSVDDAHDEVEQDQKLVRMVSASGHSGHMLRRKDSTLRRRPVAQAPSLPRVESHEDEDDTPVTPGDNRRNPPSDDTDATLRPGDEEEEEEEEQEAATGNGDEEDDGDDDNDDDDADADNVDQGDDDDDADLSDAESFTLKDRQEAINETHPFGIRIWKPALYKKDRSVQANAEGDIHSTPGGNVSPWLVLFNILWTLLFGWWLALAALSGGLVCFILGFAPGCREYGSVLTQFATYVFYPFGKYVKLEHDEAYLDEDEGEGRSISEYERWQTGDLEEGRLFFGPTDGPTDGNRSLIGRRRDSIESANETDSLLGRPGRRSSDQKTASKKRLFGRGKWNVGRIIFFVFFYGLITPLLFLASGICWFLVFTIPMGKATLLLHHHLRRHPLALSFHSDSHYSRAPNAPSSSILLCTYRAVGIKYWKYTVDGTNIFLINLLSMVAFAIFDFYVLKGVLEIESPITTSGFVFVLGLFSIIPLAYFIGQAVASISAQSSMGVGATINAFFSTIVEVFLYCVALNEGKAQLVEGSIIGSIFAGILFLPGISMCFGAIKRKTQRFNVRSAGVTSTMLLFAVIGSFSPTLFYQIYGSHELNCHQCHYSHSDNNRDCRRCYFNQTPAVHDRFFNEAVKPYIWFAAVMLFFSYVIGLLFTLRTHAAVIWNNELDEKKVEKMEQAALHVALHPEHRPSTGGVVDPHSTMTRQNTSNTIGSLPKENIRESQLYKRILGQSLKQAGLLPSAMEQTTLDKSTSAGASTAQNGTPHLVPPKTSDEDTDRTSQRSMRINGLSAQDNSALVRQVAEMAATAAAVAARDATRAPRRASQMASTPSTVRNHHKEPAAGGSMHSSHERFPNAHQTVIVPGESHGTAHAAGEAAPVSGGHDAPNWSRTKSAVILLTATLAYAIIAEILVDTVDAVLENVDIDEKFLGITLFALVPNTTEFLNAISFAMNGNIALSMEIGSAYALQVMLLQVPALVLYSTWHGSHLDQVGIVDHTFTLIFPQWDMVTVILGVFLMGWVVGEGKSNYFKGSILILAYLVIVVGFYFSGYDSMEMMGVDRFDTLALGGQFESFKTIGQGRSGQAY